MKYRTYLLHYIMGYPAVSIMSMMVWIGKISNASWVLKW